MNGGSERIRRPEMREKETASLRDTTQRRKGRGRSRLCWMRAVRSFTGRFNA